MARRLRHLGDGNVAETVNTRAGREQLQPLHCCPPSDEAE
jgi:hypothetical protein